jgi:hypothetical protein
MTASVMWRRGLIGALGVTAIAASSACVNVSAPDKPIEINLNINVKQEVVYRLDGEAKSTIKANPGIF